MGQSMKKMATDCNDKKAADISNIIEKYYDKFVKEMKKDSSNKGWSKAELYRAVCEAVEDINKELGGTQFRAPSTATLLKAFNEHHTGPGVITKPEFRKIIQAMVIHTGFLGTGAKDIVIYIFGVPITTLFVKNMVLPTAIPNDIFIPAVTSATVFALAKMNMI